MPQDEQERKGTMDEIKGKAKQAWGEATGDESKQAEGEADEMKGKARKKLGEAREKLDRDR